MKYCTADTIEHEPELEEETTTISSDDLDYSTHPFEQLDYY
jgi:hypothetical protein